MNAATTGSLWNVLETALVLSIVAACAVYAIRALWPVAWRRARVACALSLLREGSPHWLRPLGQWLAPAPIHSTMAGSCGPCRGCEKNQPTVVSPLRRA